MIKHKNKINLFIKINNNNNKVRVKNKIFYKILIRF